MNFLRGIIDLGSQRGKLNIFKEKLSPVKDAATLIVPPASVKTFVQLQGAENRYEINLQRTEVRGALKSERLLHENDVIHVTHVRMCVGLLNVNNQGSEEFTSFDDPALFNVVDPAFLMENIRQIYNGHLQITVGSVEFIPKFPLDIFYKRPDTQGDPVLGTKSAFSYRELEWETIPEFTLSGNSSIKAEFVAATNANTNFTLADANYKLIVCFDFAGFTGKGSANYVHKKQEEKGFLSV